MAIWWRGEVLQSKSVFYKQFLFCCRVIKWLQCLLGLCDDWIDPSPFYYSLESSDQLLCVSQHHWILVRKGALCLCILGLCPSTAVGAAMRFCPGPGPTHTKCTEFGCSWEGGLGLLVVGVSAHVLSASIWAWDPCVPAYVEFHLLGCSALFFGNSSHFLSGSVQFSWPVEDRKGSYVGCLSGTWLGWAAAGAPTVQEWNMLEGQSCKKRGNHHDNWLENVPVGSDICFLKVCCVLIMALFLYQSAFHRREYLILIHVDINL